jgi:hypothetical protein
MNRSRSSAGRLFKRRTVKKAIVLLLLASLVFSSSASLAADRSVNVRIKNDQGREENLKLYGASYALIIGASEYTAGWPKLPGVKIDVKEVKAALEKQGFSVTVVESPDSEGLKKAYENFINKYGLSPENRLLFYFAGHGHTEKATYGEEMGYIVPVDAPNPRKDRDGFLRKAMGMQQIEVYAKTIQSKHALFLFDSCFSGSIFETSRAIPESISYKTSKPVRQFITSGGADETVPDRSIFRQQFIAAIEGEADTDKEGYVTGSALGEFLQKKVTNYSKGSQHPQYGKIRNPNLDKGDFVFQVARAGPVEKVSRPAEAKKTPEPEVEEPATSGFSIDKIKKQAAADKTRWDRNLQEMKTAYAQVKAFDSDDATDEMKVKVWQQFLDAFADENPYASEDKELRADAKKQVERWKTEKTRIEEAKRQAEAEKARKEKEAAERANRPIQQDPTTGIITDFSTGLQWYVGYDKNTTWYEANSWVKSLLAYGSGWRMPTRAELKGLYHEGMGNRNMPPEFKTTGWAVWSNEQQGSSTAWNFLFNNGVEGYYERSSSTGRRAFAVRSR